MNLWQKILKKIEGNTPTQCARCRRVILVKHAVYKQHYVLGVVLPLCKECHAELFRPFTENPC